MNFGEVVATVRGCDGVVATAIADRDGIPVESWGRNPREIEDIIAEYSTFLRDIASANRELQLGELEQLAVAGNKRLVLVTTITEEYFLMTVVERNGNTGKARFASRLAAARLRQEFV
ncbi:MAG: roadblock/LC7 domain-containing protein [Acidobacteria bacterium]|jgi:predicted regulator of Ras-like GTPase activity (Roadblock/LC7/MglB family)|nr:roadblock/LC7 domain-containing protein [Acidobacteriota bacterium]